MQVTNSVSSDHIKPEVIPNASQKESSAECLIREVVSRLMMQMMQKHWGERAAKHRER